MYEYMDKQIAKLIVLISKTFSNFNRTCKFDNLNDLSKDTKKLYETLENANLSVFLDVAIHSYMLAYYEALEVLNKHDKSVDKVSQDEALKIAKEVITKEWVIATIISAYNPITEYVYSREVDRKRARYFESLVSTKEIQSSSKKASSVWVRQTSQYAIESCDEAKIKAYKDAGIEKVRWITEKDNKVCGDCAELEGQEFTLDMLPDKPHINCRCDYEPIVD